MAKNLKETLLSTLENGKETLENIRVMRNVSDDKIKLYNIADRGIESLHPKKLDLRVSEIIDTHKDAKIIRFVSTNGYLPPFEAGQYINIFTKVDNVLTTRPYSISSSPNQRAYYEITVARIKDGFVSDYFLDNVKVDDIFEAHSPSGTFRDQKAFHKAKALYLGGGSGITPLLSMIRDNIDLDTNKDMILIYGCRTESSALYHEYFTELTKTNHNFKYHLIVSDKDSGYTGKTGFIDANLIKELAPDYNERTSYICGPLIMNEFCYKELESLNVPIKQIRREVFGNRKDMHNEDNWPKDIEPNTPFNIKINDTIIQGNSSDSLLTTLEKNKVRVNVCCRSGECSLCRVKLVSGDIYLAKGALLRYADEKYGYVHSCKAFPISDIEIIL